jgi:hypothetical protein
VLGFLVCEVLFKFGFVEFLSWGFIDRGIVLTATFGTRSGLSTTSRCALGETGLGSKGTTHGTLFRYSRFIVIFLISGTISCFDYLDRLLPLAPLILSGLIVFPLEIGGPTKTPLSMILEAHAFSHDFAYLGVLLLPIVGFLEFSKSSLIL